MANRRLINWSREHVQLIPVVSNVIFGTTKIDQISILPNSSLW